jgi:rhodanese-related sulfurtransferase
MTKKPISKNEVPRISIQQALAAAESDEGIVICAYDDQQKCEDMRVKNGWTLKELQQKQNDLPKDTRLVFYCG